MTVQEYNNFTGDYTGSVKETDLAFVPHVSPDRAESALFSSIILESGWSESTTQLQQDARLWQVGSGRKVRVVLQVKLKLGRISKNRFAVLSINCASPRGTSKPPEHYPRLFISSILRILLLMCWLRL